MSYAFSLIARTKERAVELVEAEGRRPNVDAGVVALIVSAIRALPEAGDGSAAKMISVDAVGHHCTGSGSYEVTSHKIEVKPITITE